VHADHYACPAIAMSGNREAVVGVDRYGANGWTDDEVLEDAL